uniref:Uncharacterized protein n=1 Tax=Castor canadensis TaxID=51338 RepID=A0A8C0WDS2_CASCN
EGLEHSRKSGSIPPRESERERAGALSHCIEELFDFLYARDHCVVHRLSNSLQQIWSCIHPSLHHLAIRIFPSDFEYVICF